MENRIAEIAEATADLLVERVDRAMIRHPGLSVKDVYEEIVRNSRIGPISDRLARMKLAID